MLRRPQNNNQSLPPTAAVNPPVVPGNGPRIMGTSSAVPDLFRTSMDGGHSSSSPIKHSTTPHSHSSPAAAMAASAKVLQQQQHQQYHQQQSPNNHHLQQQQQQQQQAYQQQQQQYSNQNNLPIKTVEIDDQELTRQANLALMEGSNAVRWDMTPRAGMDYEKPNVKMFAPFLRVLGKGAFGKVRTSLNKTKQNKTLPYKIQNTTIYTTVVVTVDIYINTLRYPCIFIIHISTN